MRELFKDSALIGQLNTARQERKPWLGKGAIKNIASFFSLHDFEALINQGGIWTPDRLQVFLDTQMVPPQNLFQNKQTPAGVKPEVSLQRLQEALGRGCSLVLNDICGLAPAVMKLREILAAWTGGKIECNLYFSQRDHQAFPIHYDVHDVFAFQVAGKKRWEIFEQGVDHPINHPIFTNKTRRNPEEHKGTPVLEFDFEEGDFVYIPSGYFHHAMCREDLSLHLSFGLVEMIGMDVISVAFETAIQEAFFRTPVNAFLTERDAIESYLAQWTDHIGTLSNGPEFRKKIRAQLASFPHKAESVSIKKR